MTKIPQSLDDMLAAWNETNPSKIRRHLDKAVAPNVLFADPDNFIEGIDAFETMIRNFRIRFPTGQSARTSGFNVQHNRYRYEWLVSNGGQPLVSGMDVAEIDSNGLVIRVDGFFGPIPPLKP